MTSSSDDGLALMSSSKAASAAEADPGSRDPDRMTVWRYMAVLALAASFTGSQGPSYLIGPGVNFISDDLHIGTERSWIVVAASLSSACSAPCAGYIQDLIGRRGTLVTGVVFMLVGLIVFITSTGFIQAVAAQTLIGIGSSVQELTSIAAIAEIVPAKRRGAFLALCTAFSVCFVPALLYAELLSHGSQWRWLIAIILLWNGVTAVVLLPFYLFLNTTRESRPAGEVTWKQIDFAGIALLTVGLTIFLVALQAGGQSHPWGSAYVLVQLLVGLLLLAAFITWEFTNCRRPVIPLRLFKGQRVVGLSLLIGAFGSVNYSSSLNLGPSIIESVFSVGAIEIGLIALGPGLGLVVGSVLTNIFLTTSKGRARELLTVATIIMTAFTAAQTIISPMNSVTYSIISSFAGLGIGATIVPISTLVTLACPEDLIGTATALTITIRTVGGTIGYAILYNIFIGQSAQTIPAEMRPRLQQAGLPDDQIAEFISSYIKAVAGGALDQIPNGSRAVLQAAMEGFQYGTARASHVVFYVTIPFGVVAIAAAISLPNMRKYMTDRVLARAKKQSDVS